MCIIGPPQTGVKLFATILFPILGLMFGLLALTVKFALIAAVVFFVYSMIRKRKPGVDSELDEHEIEIE